MKKIILILSIFLITGCTANYQLNITEDKIEEKLSITTPKDILEPEILKEQVLNSKTIYPDQNKIYYTDIKADDTNYYVTFKHDHDINDFTNSKFISYCYNNNELIQDETAITLSTSGHFNCINMEDEMYMDNVKINITTDLKVLENNADEVNGNTYTWNINEENYTNKPINITMQKKQSIKNVVKNLEGNSASKDLFIIYGGLALLLGLIILLVTIKLKSNNKI